MSKKDDLLYELESELFISGNPNMIKVLSLCAEGIMLGYPEAKLIMGKLYMWGDIDGKPNDKKAYEFFWEAANEKNAEACLYVGMDNYDGVIVEKNYSLAVHYWSKSIEYYKKNIIGTDNESMSDVENYGSALGLLSRCAYEGKGIDKNYKLAFECAYEGATYCKNSLSMGILGYCYYFGSGTVKSLEEARGWWLKGIKTAEDDDWGISKAAYEKFFNDEDDDNDSDEGDDDEGDDLWEAKYGTAKIENYLKDSYSGNDYFDVGERVYTDENFDDEDDYDCDTSMDMGYMEDDDYEE